MSPRCCLGGAPLSDERVQAQAALKTSVLSDGSKLRQRDGGRRESESDFGPSLSLREGGSLCSHVQAGATRGLCRAPCAPQAHARGLPTCLLSFPVALPLGASLLLPLLICVWLLREEGKEKRGRGFICARPAGQPPQPAGASFSGRSVPWKTGILTIQESDIVSNSF